MRAAATSPAVSYASRCRSMLRGVDVAKTGRASNKNLKNLNI